MLGYAARIGLYTTVLQLQKYYLQYVIKTHWTLVFLEGNVLLQEGNCYQPCYIKSKSYCQY